MIESFVYFSFATILNLSKGYYHLPLDEETSDLCSICLPFSTFKYKWLPQEVMIAVDCFQREMNYIFANLPFAMVYLDDIIIHSYSEKSNYLSKLSIVL